jgi:hypothetical protein
LAAEREVLAKDFANEVVIRQITKAPIERQSSSYDEIWKNHESSFLTSIEPPVDPFEKKAPSENAEATDEI